MIKVTSFWGDLNDVFQLINRNHWAAGVEDVDVDETAQFKPASKSHMQEMCDSIVVGIINTIVTLPVTLAFVQIIFRSSRFAPYASALAKLAFFGSAIHQMVFCFRSSLPFAIGQIQDVGLIFLSAMSTSIVNYLEAAGEKSDAVLLKTTLLSITMSTTIVGILLIIVGKCVLSSVILFLNLN